MNTFSCVPASVEQFEDARMGRIVHDLTSRHCESLAEVLAGLRTIDLDAELRYANMMCVAGIAVLFVLTVGPALFRWRRPDQGEGRG
jgi:hypothetical protein